MKWTGFNPVIKNLQLQNRTPAEYLPLSCVTYAEICRMGLKFEICCIKIKLKVLCWSWITLETSDSAWAAIKIEDLAPSRAEAACSACCGPSAGFINTQRCVSFPCQGNIPWQDCSEHRLAPHWPKMELQWNEELRRVVQVFIWIGKRSKRFKSKFEVNRYETHVEEDKKNVILETEDQKFIPHSQYLPLPPCKQ